MIRSVFLAALTLVFSPLTLAQGDTDCRAIAAATVAELRAGYADWNDDAEQLARAAAGAACVKATTDARPVTSSQSLSSTVVRADGAQQQATVAGSSSSGASGSNGEPANEEQGEKGDDSSWNPFSDIKFNKVSASPSKKPYERRRHSLEDEEE